MMVSELMCPGSFQGNESLAALTAASKMVICMLARLKINKNKCFAC